MASVPMIELRENKEEMDLRKCKKKKKKKKKRFSYKLVQREICGGARRSCQTVG